MGDRDFLLNQINERLDLQTPLSPRDIIATSKRRAAIGGRDQQHHIGRHGLDLARARGDGSRPRTFVGDGLRRQVQWTASTSATRSAVKKLGKRPDEGQRSPGTANPQSHPRGIPAGPADGSGPADYPEPVSRTLSTRLWRALTGCGAFAMPEALRDDPSMAERRHPGRGLRGWNCSCTAKTEMITKLTTSLRRRSRSRWCWTTTKSAVPTASTRACELLFGDDAQRRYDEYFTEERRAQLQEYRKASAAYRWGFGSG